MLKLTTEIRATKKRLGLGHPFIQSFFLWLASDVADEEDPALYLGMIEALEAYAYEVSTPALAGLADVTTVRYLVDEVEWLNFLDDEVLDCAIATPVGGSCLSVITRADMLLGDMPDVRDLHLTDAIRSAAAQQAAVYFLG